MTATTKLLIYLFIFNMNKNSHYLRVRSKCDGHLTVTLNPMWKTAEVVQNILIKLFNTEIHTNGPLYSENNLCIYNNPQSDLTTWSIWRCMEGANGQKIHKKKNLHCAILMSNINIQNGCLKKTNTHIKTSFSSLIQFFFLLLRIWTSSSQWPKKEMASSNINKFSALAHK